MYLLIHDDQIGYKKSIYMQSILSVLKILNHIPAPTHLYKQKEKEKVFNNYEYMYTSLSQTYSSLYHLEWVYILHVLAIACLHVHACVYVHVIACVPVRVCKCGFIPRYSLVFH